MKRHLIVATFVVVLAAYSLGELANPASQDSHDQAATAQPNAKLSKKERKRLEKEQKHVEKENEKQQKKAEKQEREQEKHLEEKQTKEQQKQYKEQEKKVAKERERQLKEQEKQIAANHQKEQEYAQKRAVGAEKEEARDIKRHIEHEKRVETAQAAAVPAPRDAYMPRIPISTIATPRLLLAQREVSHAIYSQLPNSDVRVLLDSGNQIVLRGSVPSPSWRRRLFQLAVGVAQGYSVVDQLATNLVGSAASAATSAAIGGFSDLIHGSGKKDNGPDAGYAPPPDSAAQAAPYSQPSGPNAQHLPDRDAEQASSVLDPGSNACVNISNFTQVLLIGQATSQTSADLLRRFAHQLASTSAVVNDQLAVRSAGVRSAANEPQDVAGISGAGATASANSPAAVVSPGSTVCVTRNNDQIFLTGTVGSTADLGTVENAVQPLLGNGRLLDQLTVAAMNSGAPTADSAPPGSAATPVRQSELEQALHSIPRLAGVNVQVKEDSVQLTGSVDTAQDDQMASDVVHRYAPGRPVLDEIAVVNRTQPPQ